MCSSKRRTLEWYVQDNWRVNKRLTLDGGVRLYHAPPPYELAHLVAGFDPAQWHAQQAPALYVPAIVNGNRVAKDRPKESFTMQDTRRMHAACMHATCSVLLTTGWGLSSGSPKVLAIRPDS
jgi:hypothetical protein